MDLELAARRLEAIGNATRLRIFGALSKAGANGLAVGALQNEVGVSASSTMSHHLRRLVEADLVIQRRSGTTLVCHAREDVLDAMLRMLSEMRGPSGVGSSVPPSRQDS